MERLTLQVGTFEVNCSILSFGDRAWIVDPGSEGDRVAEALAARRLVPEAVLLTHAHFDHIGGIPDLRQRFPGLPVYVGDADRQMFGHPLNQMPPDYPSVPLPENMRSAVDLIGSVQVIPTPGHTPGGVCYYFADAKLLLSGDTLFAGSVGRTDLPGGDGTTLMGSLRRLVQLPEDTIVVPGHGPETTIAAEKAGNPFLR